MIGRDEILAQAAELRPELHRYCARMTGSVVDGEDVVQDALARALDALPGMDPPPPLRPWLFRVAHHRAIDLGRAYERRMREPLDDDVAPDPAPDPEDTLARAEALQAAVSRFIELPAVQRSAVVLKDVLDHSLDDIAELLGMTLPAVKAALHRGRVRLQKLRALEAPAPRAHSPEVERYARLFNARDWDAIRALLAEDARLDLVGRTRREGRREVGEYFSRYDQVSDWHLVPAWLEGREVLAVYRDPAHERPDYFVILDFVDGELSLIRDFRYIPYIALEAELTAQRQA